MLTVLQYAALIAAFFLPFLVGFLVQSVKAGDSGKTKIAAVVLTAACLLIALTLFLAFGIRSVEPSVNP